MTCDYDVPSLAIVARVLLRRNISRLRQRSVLREYDPKRGVSISTLAYEYPSRFQVPEHAHGSDQLIYAISGIMEVSSDETVWLIPPHFALWIPARTYHRIQMPGPVSMRTLYLRNGLSARSERRCAVLHVTPLLRELIVETVRVRSASYAGPLRVCPPRPARFPTSEGLPDAHVCDAATRRQSIGGGAGNLAEPRGIEDYGGSMCQGRRQRQDH